MQNLAKKVIFMRKNNIILNCGNANYRFCLFTIKTGIYIVLLYKSLIKLMTARFLTLPGSLLPSFKDNLFRVLGSGGSPPPILEWHIPNPPPSNELKIYRMHCTLFTCKS